MVFFLNFAKLLSFLDIILLKIHTNFFQNSIFKFFSKININTVSLYFVHVTYQSNSVAYAKTDLI